MKNLKVYTRAFILCLVFTLPYATLSSQSRSDLEQERNKIIEDIEAASSKVAAASKSTAETLAELKDLNAQIKSRQALIDNLKNQINLSVNALQANSDSIRILNEELLTLDTSYRKVMRFAHIRNTASNQFLNIFSATSISEALLLWRYGNQFNEFVTAKRQQVEHLKHVVNRKNSSLLEEQIYNNELLEAERANFEALAETQAKKDSILQQLKSKETELRQILTQKRKERNQLNNRIEAIIIKELNERSKNTKTETTTSSSVFRSKHSVPWPVPSHSRIEAKFGDQPHPSIPNVTITNNGIDILSEPNGPVLSSAKGIVIGVTKIPGFDLMIIVDHSQYYTVYSKLASAIAAKGDVVTQGQMIGKLGSSGKLHYELWKGKSKLDPEAWLIKK